MSKRVSVDGRVLVVPDDATPDEIDQISKGSASGETAVPAPAHGFFGSLLDGAENLGKGVIKGAANTASNVLSGVASANYLPALTIGANKLQDASHPNGIAQKVGHGLEQVGEFFVPGAAEEEAAAKLTPYVGKVASKIIPSAVGAGVVNKAQGGSFTGGAVAGGIGSGVAQGLKAIAPALAESALGTRRVERGFGKSPGVAALTDTTGIRPSTIARTASDKIASLGTANDVLAKSFDAANPGGNVSIQPGIDVVDGNLSRAISQNSKGVSIPQMENVRANMTTSPPISAKTGAFTTPSDPNALPGLSLSPNQTAIGAQNIKRGLRTDYISNFDPVMMKGTRSVANQAAGAIDGSLDSALGPEYESNNARMSGLFSVTDAMTRRELDPSLVQKLAAKGVAHTGALVGSGIGATAGYREGGAPGALLGGVAGFAGPEMILSPEAQMIAARTMFAPATNKFALPALTASGLQATRRRGDQQ